MVTWRAWRNDSGERDASEKKSLLLSSSLKQIKSIETNKKKEYRTSIIRKIRGAGINVPTNHVLIFFETPFFYEQFQQKKVFNLH